MKYIKLSIRLFNINQLDITHDKIKVILEIKYKIHNTCTLSTIIL